MSCRVSDMAGGSEMTQQWMIYGAYGYTGELIAHEAVKRGLAPVLGGRSEAKLAPLAERLGLPFRVFDTAHVGDQLDDLAVVLNCAGPFSATAPALVEACIASRVHYVDITGEMRVFEMCHGMDERARAAGVVLCPGAGFDIVPTDCLAATLKARVPDAQSIDLAFSFGTRPSIGTARTAIEGMRSGGLIRCNHRLTAVPNGYRVRRVPFPGGARWAVTIPWGDVYTAGVSTGVPNGMVYSATPLLVGIFMRLSNPARGLLATGWMQRLLNIMVDRLFRGGPDEEARANQRTEFWGEAVNAAGKHVSATMSAPNVYALTADTALEIARQCLTVEKKVGYCTPSMLLGAGFMASRPGVKFEVKSV
jgi:short subunit dehydrogenase-like uncharacterized protein